MSSDIREELAKRQTSRDANADKSMKAYLWLDDDGGWRYQDEDDLAGGRQLSTASALLCLMVLAKHRGFKGMDICFEKPETTRENNGDGHDSP